MASTSKQKKCNEVLEILDSSSDEDDVQDQKPAAAAASASATPTTSFYRFTRPREGGDCPICYCNYSTEDGVSLSECKHKFCQDCLIQYVQTKTKDGEVLPNQLVCPHLLVENKKCGESISQRDVLACLTTTQEQDRYLRLSLSRTIDQEDNMACCPTAGCSFQFEWDENNRKLDCPLCYNTYCLICHVGPWHTGIRCEQYQEQQKYAKEKAAGDEGDDDDDDNFKKYAKKQKLKQCPKCKFWVQKSYGCDAMHCRCNLVFCYKCGGCLKGTATRNGFNECKCGNGRLLQSHEASPMNHNLMPPDPMAGFGGAIGGGIAGRRHAAAAAAAAAMAAFPPHPNFPPAAAGGMPMGFGGGGGGAGGLNGAMAAAMGMGMGMGGGALPNFAAGMPNNNFPFGGAGHGLGGGGGGGGGPPMMGMMMGGGFIPPPPHPPPPPPPRHNNNTRPTKKRRRR